MKVDRSNFIRTSIEIILKILNILYYIMFFVLLLGEAYLLAYIVGISIPAMVFFAILFLVIDVPLWALSGKNSYIKTILVSLFILVTLGTFGTYSILYVIKIVNVQNPFLPIKIGTISDWIGYSGSILGGSMTMLAVIFTLRFENAKQVNEKNQRKYEMAIQSIPLLHIIVSQTECDKLVNRSIRKLSQKDDSTEEEIVLPFMICNKSAYFASDIAFTDFISFRADPFFMGFEDQEKVKIDDFNEEANKKIRFVNTIPGNYTENFILTINYNDIQSDFFVFDITIQYFDFTHTIKHIVKSEIQLFVEKVEMQINANMIETIYKVKVSSVQNRFME